jgi:alkylhydroperoxidase family enzyme
VSRIPLLGYEQVGGEVREEWDRQVAAHGRMTHMKRTLAHSAPALRALMEWYPLEREVAAFLGKRSTVLFAHAVSAQADCLICSTFFRRMLIEAGEDPDALQLTERERTVIEFGRQLARDANAVSDEQYRALARDLEPSQIVTLTAFGAMMLATNVFNNALRVELDEYLGPFAKAPGGAARPATGGAS